MTSDFLLVSRRFSSYSKWSVVIFFSFTVEILLSLKSIVLAATAIANIVRTSLGPLGLDKMLVDDIGVRFEIPRT